MEYSDEYEELEPVQLEIPLQKFRIGAVITEAILVLSMVVGYLTDHAIITLTLLLGGSTVYLMMSWYIFKADKYRVIDILFASFCGMLICSCIIGILFYRMSWEFADIMLLNSYVTILMGLVGTAFFYLLILAFTKRTKYQMSFSLKLLARFVILFVLFHLTGMSSSFYDLF